MKHRRKRELLAFDSPWTLDPGTIRIFRPTDGSSREETGRRIRSGEHKTPFVLETEFERQLMFTRSNVQSTMNIDYPDELVCGYTQKMMSFLLFNYHPRDILMIGLGGGSLAKFCYRYLPDSRITAVEIDADVIALRDEFYIPADDERFRIVHDDGAAFMAGHSGPVDIILVDAFDANGVAPTLAASNFYADAAARLSANGILVLNLSGDQSRYPLHLKRLRAAFDKPLLTLPVTSSDNIVVFAFKAQVPQSATAELMARAKLLETQLSLEFPRFLQRIYHEHTAVSARR